MPKWANARFGSLSLGVTGRAPGGDKTVLVTTNRKAEDRALDCRYSGEGLSPSVTIANAFRLCRAEEDPEEEAVL